MSGIRVHLRYLVQVDLFADFCVEFFEQPGYMAKLSCHTLFSGFILCTTVQELQDSVSASLTVMLMKTDWENVRILVYSWNKDGYLHFELQIILTL